MNKNYEVAFELISNAGDSKSESMMAIEAAREFNFVQAEEHLENANKKLQEAHKAQANLIHQEASGEEIDVNIILVHGQDHLLGAIITRDQAEEFVNLYKTIRSLEEKVEYINS